MANQFSMQSKAWYTPFWFMVCIMIVAIVQSLILLDIILKATVNVVTSPTMYIVVLWPLLLLVEAIIYWVIRKRLKERKWVWAHLLFSLVGFVLIRVLSVLAFIIIDFYGTLPSQATYFLMNRIEIYSYWSCVSIAQIFFIIAVVRNYSNKTLQPPDANDILSELPT